MTRTELLAGGVGRYVHWGVIQISVGNLVFILLMLLIFVLALVVPFPGRDRSDASERRP